MKLHKGLPGAEQDRNDVRALKITIKSEVFPTELLDFPNLEELYLDGNCKSFPEVLPLWDKLKVLSIKWPAFSGDLSPLFSLPKLENLKIIETPIKNFILPLGHTSAPLKFLTIKDCNLEGLPEEFSMIETLAEANLSGNFLSKLPFSFTELKKLKRLNLDNNNFEKFPDIVKKMPHLTHLSIDSNKFSAEEKARVQKEFHLWIN